MKHGRQAGDEVASRRPVPPMPEPGQVARHHLSVIHGHLATLSAHVSSHPPRLGDVRFVETLLSLTKQAAELESALPGATGREPGTCGWGHPHCPYAGDPEFEARLLARQALDRFRDRVVVVEADSLTEALLADAKLCDDVLRRLRAQVEPPMALVEDDEQDIDITFGPDGEMRSLTVDGVRQEPGS